jgi:putative phosphoribosyl transferase
MLLMEEQLQQSWDNMTNEQGIANVRVPIAEGSILEGILKVPNYAKGVVLFAHGSRSNYKSPRNQIVAQALYNAGIGSLRINLHTAEDNSTDVTQKDINTLAHRFLSATYWIKKNTDTENLNIGYFGASTGAAVALTAAAERPDSLTTIVLRSGYTHWVSPDLLKQIKAPTLLIIGGDDRKVIEFNRNPFEQLSEARIKGLVIVSGADHNFEPGKIEEVARLASSWFESYICSQVA